MGHRLDRGHPHRHRHRAVDALSPRRRARLRPPPRRLSAHAGRRRGVAGRRQRQVPAIDRRAVVRTAAVGLVLAGDAARHKKPDVHSSRSLWDSGLPRLPNDGSVSSAEARRGLRRRPRRPEAAHRRAQYRSRRRRPLPDRGGRRRLRDRRRDAKFRSRHRHDLCGADRGAAADHGVAGPLRPGAAQAHFGKPRRHPLRPRRAARRRIPGRDRSAGARDQCADRRQSRDRRARPHPCRQSGACAENAALGHRQRGDDARQRSAGAQGAGADRHHARPGGAPARARAACRALRPSSAR